MSNYHMNMTAHYANRHNFQSFVLAAILDIPDDLIAVLASYKNIYPAYYGQCYKKALSEFAFLSSDMFKNRKHLDISAKGRKIKLTRVDASECINYL